MAAPAKERMIIITGDVALPALLGKKHNITSKHSELQHILRDMGRWVRELVFCPTTPQNWEVRDLGPSDEIASANVTGAINSMPVMWNLREMFRGLETFFEALALSWIASQPTGTQLKSIGFNPVWGQVYGGNTLSSASGNLVYSFLCAHCSTACYLQWIKRRDSAECDCGNSEENIRHIMFDCSLHSVARDAFLTETGLGILNTRALDWDTILQHPRD